jgi:hypothetical protein
LSTHSWLQSMYPKQAPKTLSPRTPGCLLTDCGPCHYAIPSDQLWPSPPTQFPTSQHVSTICPTSLVCCTNTVLCPCHDTTEWQFSPTKTLGRRKQLVRNWGPMHWGDCQGKHCRTHSVHRAGPHRQRHRHTHALYSKPDAYCTKLANTNCTQQDHSRSSVPGCLCCVPVQESAIGTTIHVAPCQGSEHSRQAATWVLRHQQ